MIGTPAHCQTGTCAPALEFLVKAHERVGDKIVMVHADVYSDNAATTVAPAVAALGLDYEPVLYLVGPDGNRSRSHRRGVGSERARRAARRVLELSAQLKLDPQPQVRLALGLLIEKPAWLRPSL